MPDLSASQQALLEFLRDYIEAHRYPPSYREMAAALGFRSTNGVAYQLRCLESKGYLERDTRGAPARAIRLTELAQPPSSPEGVVQVPILGQVAAGSPALAEELHGESLLIDASLCPDQGVFGLRVKGDSMVDDGIFEGDLVIVRQRPQAADGNVVVAVVDGEATVKTFRRRAGIVWLEPANSSMEPIRVPPESDARIAGVVVGVYRQLG